MSLFLIDVSSQNHPNGAPIDWQAVAAAGVVGVLIKATEGVAYTNPYLQSDLAAARAAGLRIIFYHFAHPEANTAAAEAAFFWSVVGPLAQAGDGLAGDFEVAGADTATWAGQWAQAVHDAAGCWPLFYSAEWFITQYGMGQNAQLQQCGLWIASWGVAAPVVPAGWSFYACWQSSDSGTVAGITGPVDLDAFNGTLQELAAYGIPTPQPAPDPCTAVKQQLAQAQQELATVTADREHLAGNIQTAEAALRA